MRIAHFLVGGCHPDGAIGVSKTVYYLTRALAAAGHEVALFSLAAGPPAQIDGVVARAYPPKRFPFGVSEALLTDLHAWHPDVVHLHSAYVPPNITLGRHLRRWGVPYVVTPHGALAPPVTWRRPYLKWPYRLLFERLLLDRATFVHAVSDSDDIRRYGVTAPIVVAPNAIDLDGLPRDLDPDALRRRWPMVTGKRVFLFVGRLDPLLKGLDILLAAFARALASSRRIALVLAGPDWRGGERRLRDLARRLGVEREVLFLGPVYGREKFDLLASGDVFVHTSRSEAGLPFAVLEALACARPCLVSRRADPLGLVAAYRAGVVVEPEVDQVATSLVHLAAVPAEQLAEQGRRARHLVERELSWRKTCDILDAAYSGVVSGSPLGDAACR